MFLFCSLAIYVFIKLCYFHLGKLFKKCIIDTNYLLGFKYSQPYHIFANGTIYVRTHFIFLHDHITSFRLFIFWPENFVGFFFFGLNFDFTRI